jgi:hypothetical protein
MGADMLLMWVGAKESKEAFNITPVKTALKKLAALVKKADFKDKEWEEFKMYFSEGDDLKKEAQDAIEVAIGDLGSREVTYARFEGKIYAITGGMSWGDSPTEAFAHFDVVMRMPAKILKKAGLAY